MTLDEIRSAIKEGIDGDKAVELLSSYLAQHPDDDEALTMRGMRYWSMSRRSEAIKDYMEAVRLNPASKAAQLLRASYDILNYYNKDLLNP